LVWRVNRLPPDTNAGMDIRREPVQDTVSLGEISSVYGVKGWVRIMSWTEPRNAIAEYRPWLIGADQQVIEPLEVKAKGRGLIARLDGIESPDQAQALSGAAIAADRRQLPELSDGQYYWADLEGMTVINKDGMELGQVRRVLATGANDVLVVQGERERLIPFTVGHHVLNVDNDSGVIQVDWDAEF